MTFVTGGLLSAVELRLQRFLIQNHDAAAFDLEEPLRLEAGEVARYQFAHRADLRCQFLVTSWKLNLDAFRRSLSCSLCQTKEKRGEPVPHGGKRELFNDPHQSPQSRAHHAENFERHLRVFQAERLEILLSDQKQRGMIDGGTGGRVVSTIKHGNLRHGISRPIDAEHLLTPAGRAFEDSNMPALHHIETPAPFAL